MLISVGDGVEVFPFTLSTERFAVALDAAGGVDALSADSNAYSSLFGIPFEKCVKALGMFTSHA